LSIGALVFKDRKPISEVVVDCTTLHGSPINCGDPYTKESTVGGALIALDTGYQHRFRPWHSASVLPTALMGYAWNLGGLSREIGCDGCKEVPVRGVDASGLYVGPALKITFGGFLALGLRSEVFLTGDLAHRTILDLEVGSP
jgi:hypothetical protein